MKNKFTKIIALLCAAALMISAIGMLASCEKADDADKKNDNSPVTDKLDTKTEINVSVLNGPTGFGAAKLISDAGEKKASLNYKFTVETDASNILGGLINGSIDIAALPTNAAANAYNKTGGKVKIVAINTLGVLYVVSTGAEITSFTDLKGKTVYCPAQNPEFILKALCKANGLTVGEDITIDTSFAQPADLRTAVAAGQVEIAVLPEPMVTIAKSANPALTVALDLTAEWEKVNGESSLAQGCVVVRTEWAEKNPAELAKFLEEYKASVEFTVANPKEASELIVATGVFAGKAPVAEKAIPKCNIVYIDGEAMVGPLNTFFSKLFDIAPTAIGGKLPDDGIYYIK